VTFVVSQGQLSGVAVAPSLTFPTYVQLASDVYQEYGALYRRQPQIRTVVSFLARNIAQLGLHTYRRVSDTDRERLTDHPLARILAAPGAKLTRYRLIERLVCDYAIYDAAFWVKVRLDTGELLGVIPVPPPRMEVQGDNWLEPQRFVVHGSKGKLELAPDEVVHFHGYDPDDLRKGSSPIEALRSMLAEEFEATRSREQMWRNGGRMSGVLKRPADAPKWDPTSRARFGESWKAYTAGGGSAGGTPILEDGMEYEQIALDPSKAQYIEARKLTREEVAAAYHIPLPMVGILDHATFSNIREQHQQLYQDTLGPWLTMIQEEIALQLIPDLPDSGDVYVEFNLQEKLRGSFEEQASQLQTAVGAPWLLRNEARARMNLPAIDGGDELITPLNVLVGDMASPTDTAPELAAPPKARGRLVLMKAAPERPELGSFGEERDAFVAALETWTRRRFDDLLSRADGKSGMPDLLSWWDEGRKGRLAELATLVSEHGYRIAQGAAWGVLQDFNPEASGWDPEVMLPWLLAAAETHAGQHDDSGRAAVAEVNDEGDGWKANLAHAGQLWAVAATTRALTASAEARGFGSHDAAGASGLKKKTWRTGGKNPRPSHQAQDGETVSLDDVFSNGLRWPGDGEGKAKETANCNCSLDYARGD
jgi:HK97 family phage portal protein